MILLCLYNVYFFQPLPVHFYEGIVKIGVKFSIMNYIIVLCIFIYQIILNENSFIYTCVSIYSFFMSVSLLFQPRSFIFIKSATNTIPQLFVTTYFFSTS